MFLTSGLDFFMGWVISFLLDGTIFFYHFQQSLTFIIFDGLSQILVELQRVLCNRRENQECFSSISLQLSELTWRYIVGIM
jgi:hypothetical protein